MKTVPLHTVSVRRDAMTTIPTTVAQHEIAILTAVHGEDNVYPVDANAGSIELDSSGEAQRLVGKYGQDAVVKAYGVAFAPAIAQALSSAEAKPKRAAAAA